MNRLYNFVQSTFYIQRALQAKPAAGAIFQLRTIQSQNCFIGQKATDAQKAGQNAAKPKGKQNLSPKITLIGQNQSISVTSLEDAQKLAKRRDLHLMLVQELDTKTQRPVYKLATSSEYLAEELQDLKSDGKTAGGKNAAHKKSEKTLTIGSRISDNDLASRQKNICKWLAKQHEVRILIQGGPDDMASMERIFKMIEQSLKEPKIVGKIQQKRSKGSHIKFSIVPIITPIENVINSSSTASTATSSASTSASPSSSSSS